MITAGSSSELPISTMSSGGGNIAPDLIASSSSVFSPAFIAQEELETPNTAGLTDDDLLALWKSVTEPGYHRALLERGEGEGDEIARGPIAIHREASASIGATTQSLYLRPWSGQTAEPSHMARRAVGFLQIERDPTAVISANVPIVFSAQVFFADHVGIDWGEFGAVEFLSGRRYFVSADRALGAGEVGPILIPAIAEKAGSSYNRPGPGTIRGLTQSGSGLNNTGAVTSNPQAGVNLLTLGVAPDLLSPAQVGQYLQLTSPSTVAGQVRRILAYTPPTSGLDGGVAQLDAEGVYLVSGVSGTWTVGETVVQASTGAKGVLLSTANAHFVIRAQIGVFSAAAIAGSASGATATIARVIQAAELPAATAVSWQVLDWELDLGLRCTNPESFTGGRLPILEELGEERGIRPGNAEPEETYRARVIAADDVVSPNALQRVANRVLAAYGGRGCLREVGSSKLPGLFYDVPADGNPDHAFAYDMDPVVRLGDRWKVILDFASFRGFFLMGVPRFGLGDVSVYADVDPGLDSETTYLDGEAFTDIAIHSAVYSGLLTAHAGGVGFELYVEADGCV
jgi:hypothetical protein